jgi:tetratricopeptide (TPR) repeat protein
VAYPLLPQPAVRMRGRGAAAAVLVAGIAYGAEPGAVWVNARPVSVEIDAPRPVVRVERVAFSTRPGPAVTLTLSAGAQPVAKALPATATAPARVYVDVPSAVLVGAVPRTLRGGAGVTRVRTGQFDRTTARVIVDLARPMAFALTVSGRTAVLALRGDGGHETRRAAAARPTPAPRSPAPAAAAGPARPAPPPPPAVEPAAAAPAPITEAPVTIVPAPVAEAETSPATPVPAPAAEPAADAAGVVTVNGHPFVWPSLDAPEYADAADALREGVRRWRDGAPPARAPLPEASTPAARYLVADLVFLDATLARRTFFDAAAAYERALRDAPDFPDAPRAYFVLGQANLALEFGPEATAAFQQLERRFPTHPLALEARLGRAAALRLRHRPAEARALVADIARRTTGAVHCRALREQALNAETPVAATTLFRTLATACPAEATAPDTLAAHAEALVREGNRDAARALLAAPRPPARADAEARLTLLAASLEPDPQAARAAYERLLGIDLPPGLALEARMRLALLDGADDPAHAAAALVTLAATRGPMALRALILGEAAEMYARAGRWDDALAVLDRAAARGPDGAAQANGRRGEIVGRWIASLAARGDVAGVATVYAAHRATVHELGSVDDRLGVARALGRLGLHAEAAELLALTTTQTRSAEAALALGEEALAAGDLAAARGAAARLAESPLDAPLAARHAALAARLALAAGDVAAAADAAGRTDDLGARAAVASALLDEPDGAVRAAGLLAAVDGVADAPPAALVAAARAALATGDAARAVALARRAVGGAGDDATRTLAAATLLRAATAAGDRQAATDAADAAAQSADPVVRRSAEAVRRSLATANARSRRGG